LKILFVFAAFVLAGCVGVDAGHEAVLVQKPWFFGHGGVVDEPLLPGRAYIAPSTQAIDVNMQPQRFDFDADDMMSSDGVPLDFHAVMTVRVTESVRLIEQFGERWYQNNLEQPFASAIRQAVRKHGMNEVAISATAIEAIDDEIREALLAEVVAKNLPVEMLSVTVGRANPPDAVKNQRVETAQNQQRAITEEQRRIAEDARLAAETSRAAADNAYRQAMQLSPDQFLALETIKMQQEVCGPNGKANCTFIQNGAAQVYNLAK
jgi:regulator of protease activity HflC (stomatin/prohibitin superfamily)